MSLQGTLEMCRILFWLWALISLDGRHINVTLLKRRLIIY